jgi:ParB-like chromosome segregation protein Spo0J
VTTVAVNTDHTAVSAELFDNADTAPQTSPETAGPVYIGEIVTEPIQLNTGDEAPLPPFRAGILDARLLRDSPLHPRQEIGLLDDLIPSVKLFGVRDPLVVISRPVPANELPSEPNAPTGSSDQDAPVTEVFEVLGGKRRQYAAIAAERYFVPCVIVEDEGDAVAILSILEMNSHGKDLERIEEANAYQMLLDIGWDELAIAQARNLPVDAVRTAVKARNLPARAQRALNAGVLTLEMATGLEEFEDSPQDVERLLAKITKGEWDFKHTLGQLRDKREYAKNKELAKAQLIVAKVDVTPKPRGFGYDGTAVAIDQLVDSDGQPLDAETVKTLPGFHAFVEKNGGQARSVVYCDDPDRYGYSRKTPNPHPGLTPQEIAEKEEQQRQHEEFLDQLRVAADVRREFLVATYGSAKTARKLAVDALRAANNGRNMHRSSSLDDLYRTLGGLDAETIATSGEDRLRRSLVAKYVCSQEHNLAQGVQGHLSWINKDPAIAWFDRLTADGYPLTDAEDELYLSLLPAVAEADDDNEEDKDDNEEDEDTVTDDDDAQGIVDGDTPAVDDEVAGAEQAQPALADSEDDTEPGTADSVTASLIVPPVGDHVESIDEYAPAA